MIAPSVAIQNVINCLYPYTETVGQRYLAATRHRSRVGTDRFDFGRREFGCTRILTRPGNMPTFENHVSHVGGLITLKKVGTVAARWVITAMESMFIPAKRSDLEVIRYAVNPFQFPTADADDSVAVGVTETAPRPTGVRAAGFIDSRPQPYVEWLPRLAKGAASRRAEASVTGLNLIGARQESAEASIAGSRGKCFVHESTMPHSMAYWNRLAWESLQ